MIIERKEPWGILQYDTKLHRFSYDDKGKGKDLPYAYAPIVLNVDLTMKCNMACKHCVAKDFGNMGDLFVDDNMVSLINKSPFMVIVITGGEPTLPEYEDNLITMLSKIKNKGLMIDTNGTIKPKASVMRIIKKTNTLIRVSWDSVRPQDELYLRVGNPHESKTNQQLYDTKIAMIKYYLSKGIDIAVQTVINRKNVVSVGKMPEVLSSLQIKQWYLQRFIPSHQMADSDLGLSPEDYQKTVTSLGKKCAELKIECIAKRDRRHNSVFLLVGDGKLYTQGEKPRQKICLGVMGNVTRFFDYVSSPDHSERYYG